jgi:hypothetical protein
MTIKIVRSDRGGEYYGRHAPYDQFKGPFTKYLDEGEPHQNGVAKRHNRTLMDMVRSTLNYSNLLEACSFHRLSMWIRWY